MCELQGLVEDFMENDIHEVCMSSTVTANTRACVQELCVDMEEEATHAKEQCAQQCHLPLPESCAVAMLPDELVEGFVGDRFVTPSQCIVVQAFLQQLEERAEHAAVFEAMMEEGLAEARGLGRGGHG